LKVWLLDPRTSSWAIFAACLAARLPDAKKQSTAEGAEDAEGAEKREGTAQPAVAEK
jgi:hypothetical protein